MSNFYIFIVSFFSSALGVFIVKKVALKNHYSSLPSKDRWHKNETALFGGVGFIPIVILLSIMILFNQKVASSIMPFVFIFGVLVMFITGLLDDIRPLGPFKKLFIQFFVAGLFIYSGGMFHIFQNSYLNILITLIWFIVCLLYTSPSPRDS